MRDAMRRAVRLAGWPARAVLLGAIFAYRRTLGPLFAGRCRFYPSCSNYAVEAIEAHGALKGGLLAIWRVLRCSPLSAGGPDPVPAPRSWKPGEAVDVR
jgi:putative membrane protein insertion efficiency factor